MGHTKRNVCVFSIKTVNSVVNEDSTTWGFITFSETTQSIRLALHSSSSYFLVFTFLLFQFHPNLFVLILCFVRFGR